MASPSGAPPAASNSITKDIAPEKKRLFILLGVGGVLALLVGGRFVLGALGGSGSDTATNAVVVANPEGGASPGSPPVASGEETVNPQSAGGVPPGGVTPVSAGANNPAALLPLARYRSDPFQPFVIVPPPQPPPPPTPKPPPPTPTPAPPVAIPAPEAVFVPSPGSGFGGGGFGSSSGSFGGSGEGSTAPFSVPQAGRANSVDQMPILPSVVIPRLNARNTAPTDAFPPPRSSSGGGNTVTSPSFNKRLSGVVIGSGVRAVLEINDGDSPKSYIVQPGDVVEGITVLSINRFNEGGNQVTRMLVRENGGERYIDLKAGPPRTQTSEGGLERGGGGGFGTRP